MDFDCSEIFTSFSGSSSQVSKQSTRRLEEESEPKIIVPSMLNFENEENASFGFESLAKFDNDKSEQDNSKLSFNINEDTITGEDSANLYTFTSMIEGTSVVSHSNEVKIDEVEIKERVDNVIKALDEHIKNEEKVVVSLEKPVEKPVEKVVTQEFDFRNHIDPATIEITQVREIRPDEIEIIGIDDDSEVEAPRAVQHLSTTGSTIRSLNNVPFPIVIDINTDSGWYDLTLTDELGEQTSLFNSMFDSSSIRSTDLLKAKSSFDIIKACGPNFFDVLDSLDQVNYLVERIRRLLVKYDASIGITRAILGDYSGIDPFFTMVSNYAESGMLLYMFRTHFE